jgi:2-methylcitrate dehydratase PrpD
MERHGLAAADIDGVIVDTYSGALRLANRPEPHGFTDIQFSIPYCLGIAALGGRQALLPLTMAAVDRADIGAFARKVSLRLDPELDGRFPAETLARVSVEAGGQHFVSPVTAPRGEASDPPSWDALEAKLRTATRFIAAPAEQEALLDAVRRLRDGDHADLMRRLGLRLSRRPG